MPHEGGTGNRSLLNTWFYNVEFGTGRQENVGGMQWVRRQGISKDESGDGSWWVNRGQSTQKGMKLTGQKGFHFLFEERTRKPRKFYEELIERRFPEFLDQYIRTHALSGDGVLKRG